MHAARINGTPVAGVAERRRNGARAWFVMTDQGGGDTAIRFSTVGKLAIVSWATTIVALLGWSVQQSMANGAALAGVKAELAIRVEKADREHASYATRAELTEIVRRLDERMADLAAALRSREGQRQ